MMTFHSRSDFLFTSLLLAGLMLGGCSSVTESTGAPDTAEAPEEITTNDVADIPTHPLSSEELELLLDAELSAYRQEGERAADLYIEAADLTRDAGVARRGFELAMTFGETEAALELAQIWREIEPGLPADRYAAQLFARVGETEAAWELSHSLDDEGMTLRIVAAETLGLNAPDRAVWLESQLATLEEPGYQAWIARALLREALDDPEGATQLARRAYLQRPDTIISAELYASFLARQERYDDLELLLNGWLLAYWTGEPNQTRVARMVAQLPLSRAINILRNAIAQNDNTAELEMLLGQAYLNVPDLDAAEAIFQRLVEQPEYMDAAQTRLGQVAENRDLFDQAVERYRSVAPGPYFGPANDRAGEILLSEGTREEFNAFFDAQREAHPQAREELFIVQATLLNEFGEDEALVELTTAALEQLPEQTDLLYVRSLALERLGQMDAAEADLRRLVELEPDNAQFLNALGYQLTDNTDRHEEAYSLIREALSLDPENAAIIDSMGWVLYNLGQYEEALLYLQEALNRFYNEEIIVHLAQTLIRLDRHQEAQDLIREARENLPGSQMIQDAEQSLDFTPIDS